MFRILKWKLSFLHVFIGEIIMQKKYFTILAFTLATMSFGQLCFGACEMALQKISTVEFNSDLTAGEACPISCYLVVSTEDTSRCHSPYCVTPQ
jgi:hypothetical protein